jgi:hypothetical protein
MHASMSVFGSAFETAFVFRKIKSQLNILAFKNCFLLKLLFL